jgi:hypothetical protein
MATPIGEPHYFFRRGYQHLREGALPDAVEESAGAASPPYRSWAMTGNNWPMPPETPSPPMLRMWIARPSSPVVVLRLVTTSAVAWSRSSTWPVSDLDHRKAAI